MKISVVTPSFNQAAFLAETLASVRAAAAAAHGHQVEHIVMDGGSTDGSLEILGGQDFARWESAPDRGQADAINRGLAAATGDVLAYLCSDDLYEPDALARAAQAFAEAPEPDVVYGDYFFLESDSGWKRRKIAGPWSRERLLRGNFISQPATFWRRSVYARFGGFDPSLRYCLDHEYWLRISPNTRWRYVPEPLATMRLHAGSKTGGEIARMWWESARMQTRFTRSPRPWWDALWMQACGQYYYRAKRIYFRWRGHRRAR